MQQGTTIDFQAATLEGQIQQRAAEVKAADARLAELLNGSRIQDKQQAQANVDRAQTEYVRSANDWKRAQTLFKNEDISASDYDQYRMHFETADAQLKTAKEQLSLVLEGPRTEDIDNARAQLGEAQAALQARRSAAAGVEAPRARKWRSASPTSASVRRTSRSSIRSSPIPWPSSPVDGVVLVKSADAGRSAGARNHRRDRRRYRPSLAARLYQRDRPWRGEARRQGPASPRIPTPGKVYDGRVSSSPRKPSSRPSRSRRSRSA